MRELIRIICIAFLTPIAIVMALFFFPFIFVFRLVEIAWEGATGWVNKVDRWIGEGDE